jgi:16S rRNA (guanine1207-N2)-methyltransferase
MSEHYYADQPSSESNPKTWSYELNGYTIKFTSDDGVFSKKEVDFGSKLMLELYSDPAVKGNILDMGCGYGPIGLTVAKQYSDRTVWMVDVNERALSLSKLNAKQNNVGNIKVLKSYLFDELENEMYASVITNPPIRAGKKVVHQLFEQAYEHILPNGELWVVIQKKQGAPSAIEKLESLFSEVEVVGKKKGYYIIKSKKY